VRATKVRTTTTARAVTVRLITTLASMPPGQEKLPSLMASGLAASDVRA
jgi:hypothetical protein